MSKVFFTDFLSIKAYVLSKITYIKGSSRPVVSALGLAHWIVGVFKGFSFCTTMSASARFIRAALTAAAEEEIRVVNYANYAKTTVLAYEILINLGREVDLVWSAKFRWSSLIYFMNRYPVVAFQIWELCYSTKIPQYVRFFPCDAWYSFFWYASFLPTRAAITASFALRVYAIMDGNLMFPVVLSLLGIAVIGCDIWQGVQSSCTQFSDKTCTCRASTSSFKLTFSLRVATITTFMFLACFDILSTLLVTVRMFRNIIWSGGFKGLGSQNVAAYILKSGVLYFGVVTIPQLVAIALYFDPKEGSATILNNVMLV
ncbi:hypothetical protein BT96DRAFT_998492 [Gymnopus androsaceus JB14]|uniref:DUF6533 domain-containing protein n=1 Tax=Gymnopus androsaceus JB14 TaxID=1447944 RepID=A0A6A4HA35_9AGAR|nr:hypothetical protein BT96DRAFT_998492 [Gymnopus androsaceus JB14]